MIRSSQLSQMSSIVVQIEKNQGRATWVHQSFGQEIIDFDLDVNIKVFSLSGFSDHNCNILGMTEDGSCYVWPLVLNPAHKTMTISEKVLFCQGLDFNLFELLWKLVLNDDVRYVAKDSIRFVNMMKTMCDRRFNGEWRKYHRDTYPEYSFDNQDTKSNR